MRIRHKTLGVELEVMRIETMASDNEHGTQMNYVTKGGTIVSARDDEWEVVKTIQEGGA